MLTAIKKYLIPNTCMQEQKPRPIEMFTIQDQLRWQIYDNEMKDIASEKNLIPNTCTWEQKATPIEIADIWLW